MVLQHQPLDGKKGFARQGSALGQMAWGAAKGKIKTQAMMGTGLQASATEHEAVKEKLSTLKTENKKKEADDKRHWKEDPRLRPLIGAETQGQSYVIPRERKNPSFQPSLWVRDRALMEGNVMVIPETAGPCPVVYIDIGIENMGESFDIVAEALPHSTGVTRSIVEQQRLGPGLYPPLELKDAALPTPGLKRMFDPMYSSLRPRGMMPKPLRMIRSDMGSSEVMHNVRKHFV